MQRSIIFYVLVGDVLGISYTTNLKRKQEGESLIIKQSQMHNIISLKKEIPLSKISLLQQIK